MKIKAITIVQGIGADKVMLQTEYPSPCPGFCGLPLCVDFDAAYNTGPAYVAENFPGVPVTLVERSRPNYQFSRPPVEELVQKAVKPTRRLRA